MKQATFFMLTLLLLGFFLMPKVSLSQVWTSNPGTVFSVTGGGHNWNNEANADLSDDVYAFVFSVGGGTTQYLHATGFNFTVPPGAIINGIEVLLEKSSSDATNVFDQEVLLLKSSGTVGSNHAKLTSWTGSDSVHSYGSSNDLWGTTLSAAEVNSSTFGLSVQITSAMASTPTMNIDQVILRINYSVLPIELISFKASPIGNDVLLDWVTATESDNEDFTIEKSIDGTLWLVAGILPGAGNSDQLTSYQFTDKNLLPGKYLYRIKTIDIDGSYDYSPSVEIIIKTGDLFEIFVSYSSNLDRCILTFTDAETRLVSGEIFSIQGEKVSTFTSSSTGELSLSQSGVGAGTYVVQAQNGQKKISKLIVLR